MRLLVIEDDDDLRDSVCDELQSLGHEVRGAVDGLEGWALLNDDSTPLPNVILLDLSMPHLNGHQFRIRQLAETHLAAIPTIVLTAANVDTSLRESLGRILIVPKLTGFPALIAAIAEAAEPKGHVTKRCDCGIIYDSGRWQALRKVGEIDNGRDVGERLELRNCTCESTLAWEVGRHAISVPAPRK